MVCDCAQPWPPPGQLKHDEDEDEEKDEDAVAPQRAILAGQHFHLYLIGYGLFRFAHEFLRATPRVGPGFTGYQVAALAVAALGVSGFIRRAKIHRRSVAS